MPAVKVETWDRIIRIDAAGKSVLVAGAAVRCRVRLKRRKQDDRAERFVWETEGVAELYLPPTKAVVGGKVVLGCERSGFPLHEKYNPATLTATVLAVYPTLFD